MDYAAEGWQLYPSSGSSSIARTLAGEQNKRQTAPSGFSAVIAIYL